MSSTALSTKDFIATLQPRLQKSMPHQGVIADFMHWACTGWSVTPPAMHLAAILAVLAHEGVRHGFSVRPSPAFKLPPFAIRVLLVAESAAGKSSALQAARQFHQMIRVECLTKHRPDGSEIPDPWVNFQGSEPGLEEALTERYEPSLNMTPVIAHHEEFTSILNGGSRGSHNATPDWYNRTLDGRPAHERVENTKAAKAARKEAGKAAENPVCQGLFCSTPAALRRAVTDVHREGGMLSRIGLWVTGNSGSLPLPFLVQEEEARRTAELEHIFQKMHKSWDDLCAFIQGPDARVIDFAPDARDYLNEFVRTVKGGGEDDEMTAVRIRGVGVAINIAALYALSQAGCPDRRDTARGQVLVRLEDAKAAVNWVVWSWETQQAMYDATTSVAQAGTVSVPTMRFTDRIYQVILEAGPDGIELQALRRRVSKWSGFNAQVYRATIEDLTSAESGLVRKHTVKTSGRPVHRLIAEKYPRGASEAN